MKPVVAQLKDRMTWEVILLISVTRLGDFWKLVATKSLTKVAQIIGNFLGYFEKTHSYVKTAVATFWATFGIIWATFFPTSVHTAADADNDDDASIHRALE